MARIHRKLGPARITIAKGGLGYSVGGPFLRVTKRVDGRVQRTWRVPRTGLHDTRVVGPRAAGRPGRPSNWAANSGAVEAHTPFTRSRAPGSVFLLIVGTGWAAGVIVLLVLGSLLNALLLAGLGAFLFYCVRDTVTRRR
ncbi:DUF4236 domain-containing protein [Nocardia sp. CWNU-33]|uniref:DUF4236 domain-containing protein n=1 Tax=Nocardia sp. CWNU-33 TaxID=3392117 RepID=UPI00398EEBED